MDSFDVYQKQEDLTRVGNPGDWGEEFAAELGDKLSGTDSNIQAHNTYSGNGIKVQNEAGRIIVTYNGVLAKSGAKDIYATVGYGNNTGWGHTANYQMHAGTHGGFEVMIPTRGSQSINIRFKDGSGRLDNNNGSDYTVNNPTGWH